MSTDAPTLFGKYRILDLLGEGAMGIVYRAEDTMLMRRVAVKVMTEAIARQSDLRDRFLREARAAGSLQHPNVVTVYDFGEVNGHLFIAMELVDGSDLEQLMAGPDPVPLDAKLSIVSDLLVGLAYAHKHGVVHRDIKPANIRVTSDGRAKIMDFGIAYVGSSDLTRTGLAIGTPSYMAPEQVTGGKVTAESDIFSAGVVLYELLTGVKPFAGPTLHSILFKIVSEAPPDLAALAPDLPPAVVQIVTRALQKDPADRYPSALEMANELAAARAAAAAASGAAVGQWTLSLRAASPALLNASRVGIASTPNVRIASSSPALARAPEVAADAPAVDPRRSSAGRVWWIGGAAAACVLGALGALWAVRQPAAPVAGPPSAERAAVSPPSAAETPSTAAVTTTDAATIPPANSAVTARPAPNRPSVRSVAPPATAAIAAAPARAAASHVAILPQPGARSAGTPAVGQPGATTPVPGRVIAAAPTPAAAVEAAGPPAAAPASAAPSAATTSAEIADAARAYARAIESRDVAAVRRAYPGLTDAQERGFRQFFDAARNLRVTFSVSGVDVAGNTADAHLAGTYEYTSTDGQHQRQPVDFAATLRRDGGAWHLTSVR